jgi:hypothetical protein
MNLITDFRDLQPSEKRTMSFSHYDPQTDVPRDAFIGWLKESNNDLNQTQLIGEFFRTAALVEPHSMADARLTQLFREYTQAVKWHTQFDKPQDHKNDVGRSFKAMNTDMFERRYNSLGRQDSVQGIVSGLMSYDMSGRANTDSIFNNHVKSITGKIHDSLDSTVRVRDVGMFVQTC